jgi:hypothetical protein
MRARFWSAILIAAMTFSFSAFAAGIDSRGYTCAGLHALVAANRLVFINYPSFMDFVVANGSVLPERLFSCAAYRRATTPSAS